MTSRPTRMICLVTGWLPHPTSLTPHFLLPALLLTAGCLAGDHRPSHRCPGSRFWSLQSWSLGRAGRSSPVQCLVDLPSNSFTSSRPSCIVRTSPSLSQKGRTLSFGPCSSHLLFPQKEQTAPGEAWGKEVLVSFLCPSGCRECTPLTGDVKDS